LHIGWIAIHQNQLRSAENAVGNGGTTGYRYQADGLMRFASPGNRRFFYDGSQQIAEYEDPGAIAGSDAILQQRIIRIPGSVDEPLLIVNDPGGTATEHWTYQDERGSVVATTNENSNEWFVFTYDEYGLPADIDG